MERRSSRSSVRSQAGDNKRSTSKNPSRPTSLDSNLSNISTSVYDNCCFLIYCEKHCNVMLTRGTKRYMPYFELNANQTWADASMEAALHFVLGKDSSEAKLEYYKSRPPFQQFNLVHLFRFQLPQSEKFVTRLIYLVVLNSEQVLCCQTTDACRWYPIKAAIASKLDNVWGPEVSYFANLLYSDGYISETVSEYSLQDAFKYMTNSENGNEGEDRRMAEMRALLVNLSAHDVERIYADYIEHTFPSFFMTRDSFLVYMAKHEIVPGDPQAHMAKRLYHAFRYRDKPYMCFTELLLGLAAIDVRTKHQEARVRLVFRYYDYNHNNRLSLTEFKRMYGHLHPKQRAINDRDVLAEMHRIGSSKVRGQEAISYEAYKRAVANRTLTGTSRLCRATNRPFAQITRSLAARKLFKTVGSSIDAKSVLVNRHYSNRCQPCLGSTFVIASNWIQLGPDGRCVKWGPISDVGSVKQGASASSRYSLEVTFPKKESTLHFIQAAIHKYNKKKETFDSKGLMKPNILFQDIGNIGRFIDDVSRICFDLASLVEKEDRVLKLPEPIYLIGDIHGNLEDLLTLEKMLWRSAPFLSANYLFLGDFVDRGKWGFECFLYLAIMKLLNPSKVFLLRGNHEVRAIQRKYTFYKELVGKYGADHGNTIFDNYNRVFDRLPFCAVINRSIYAAHGGIPCTIINLDAIEKVTPHCVPEPERQAPAEWQILWSDPMDHAKWPQLAHEQGVLLSTANTSYMYLFNKKRGTAFYFNEYALMRFLHANGLQFVIRAHEVPAEGFAFHFDKKCTTIFSCSHYCNNNNECSVLLIGREGRMRLIRIDTSHNQPAM